MKSGDPRSWPQPLPYPARYRRGRCSDLRRSATVRAYGEREEVVRRVVVCDQLPSSGQRQAGERAGGQRLVLRQRPAVPGGERRAPRGVEQYEQTTGAGDAGEFSEPSFGVGQVVDQAGGEERVRRRVGERQLAGVGEDE